MWARVPGTQYEVSDTGDVRGPRGLLNPGPNSKGYRVVRIGGRHMTVAHAMLLAFVGPRPDGAHARHLDDVKSNDTLPNLAWGSCSDNGLDAVRNGLNWQAVKTKCPSGHRYDEENTLYAHGRRYCLTCRKSKNEGG